MIFRGEGCLTFPPWIHLQQFLWFYELLPSSLPHQDRLWSCVYCTGKPANCARVAWVGVEGWEEAAGSARVRYTPHTHTHSLLLPCKLPPPSLSLQRGNVGHDFKTHGGNGTCRKRTKTEHKPDGEAGRFWKKNNKKPYHKHIELPKKPPNSEISSSSSRLCVLNSLKDRSRSVFPWRFFPYNSIIWQWDVQSQGKILIEFKNKQNPPGFNFSYSNS